jgi:hypothetical protein
MIAITKGKGNECETITEYNGLQAVHGPGEKVRKAGEWTSLQ